MEINLELDNLALSLSIAQFIIAYFPIISETELFIQNNVARSDSFDYIATR